MPATNAPKNIPKILAKLPNNGISKANTGIAINPFSMVSPKSIAPPAVRPAIIIFPTSNIKILKGFFLEFLT